MTDIVDQTLKLWRSTSFEWGARDCMLSVGDYIASRGGLDVTGQFRGTYDTEAGAMAHVERVGGVCALVEATGIPAIDRPGRGDVLVVNTGTAHVGAICTGPGAAMRLDRGVIEVTLRFVEVVGAWGFENVGR